MQTGALIFVTATLLAVAGFSAKTCSPRDLFCSHVMDLMSVLEILLCCFCNIVLCVCGFRLVSTSSGCHRQHSSSADILDKLWTSVVVEPLSRNELLQVTLVNRSVLVCW